ncbi:hypothetical protein DCAR_0934858 [Daucus carota subsp. sativus]|uniref:Knottin scorpion toxin-like domain-containing protein n=1 Tax=Daucus carota subsp. sativus TaxID=79200 RepID=A0AAF1BIS6_DAUCS|nr:hypothetical protein DCAR_0934858 [Daucus carota subsp. sativus]
MARKNISLFTNLLFITFFFIGIATAQQPPLLDFGPCSSYGGPAGCNTYCLGIAYKGGICQTVTSGSHTGENHCFCKTTLSRRKY